MSAIISARSLRSPVGERSEQQAPCVSPSYGADFSIGNTAPPLRYSPITDLPSAL